MVGVVSVVRCSFLHSKGYLRLAGTNFMLWLVVAYVTLVSCYVGTFLLLEDQYTHWAGVQDGSHAINPVPLNTRCQFLCCQCDCLTSVRLQVWHRADMCYTLVSTTGRSTVELVMSRGYCVCPDHYGFRCDSVALLLSPAAPVVLTLLLSARWRPRWRC